MMSGLVLDCSSHTGHYLYYLYIDVRRAEQSASAAPRITEPPWHHRTIRAGDSR